jgi:hypothetical protein
MSNGHRGCILHLILRIVDGWACALLGIKRADDDVDLANPSFGHAPHRFA